MQSSEENIAVELNKSLSDQEYEMVEKSRNEIDPLIVNLTDKTMQRDFLGVVATAADLAIVFFAIGREAGKQEANAAG